MKKRSDRRVMVVPLMRRCRVVILVLAPNGRLIEALQDCSPRTVAIMAERLAFARAGK